MFKYVKRYWPAAAAVAVALALPAAALWAVDASATVAETACCCCPLCCL